MRRLTATLVAVALVLVLPAGASAAAPANDLPAGATVLPTTLPQAITQDTTQATVTPADDVGCGAGGLDQATVWYRITPTSSVNVLIDATASGYGVGVNVFAGTPTPEANVTCFEGPGFAELEAGTAYYLMFADVDADDVNGGQLSVAIDTAPPPIEVTVAVDPIGKVQQKAGTVVLTGTIACDQVAEFAFIEINVRQRVGRYVIRGFGFVESTTCGPEPVEWSADIFPENGRFGGGKASVDLFAAGCDPLQCGESQQTFNVRLRR